MNERFKMAIRSIRQQGIVVKTRVGGCCRSCVDLDIADNTPIIWHFTGQGYDKSEMYFNHANLFKADGKLNDAGERVANTLDAYSVKFVMPDNESRCITISLEGNE